jgi:hypothetical protein
MPSRKFLQTSSSVYSPPKTVQQHMSCAVHTGTWLFSVIASLGRRRLLRTAQIVGAPYPLSAWYAWHGRGGFREAPPHRGRRHLCEGVGALQHQATDFLASVGAGCPWHEYEEARSKGVRWHLKKKSSPDRTRPSWPSRYLRGDDVK